MRVFVCRSVERHLATARYLGGINKKDTALHATSFRRILAAATLCCIGASNPLAAAGSHVIYSAKGTFAAPAIRGADLLQVAGQPFSISILADQSMTPTKHSKTLAQYTNLPMAGTVTSGLAGSVPLSSASTSVALKVGAVGEPDELDISFPLSILSLKLTVSAKVFMPVGTITALAIEPFTAPVPLTLTNAIVTYSEAPAYTTLEIANGTLNSTFETPAPGLTTLYSFTGQNGDGANPAAGLALGQNGKFYGTTSYGGTIFGTVFELAPPAATGGAWTETVLYAFGAGSDGANPSASVVIGSNGALYGTTSFGTAFELTPPVTGGAWTLTALHTFAGHGDGAIPNAGLVIDKSGVLYGTTTTGGSSNFGTVFELRPPAAAGGTWTETVLHSFAAGSGDGANPYAGLVIGSNGSLYGTTAFGGSSNYGIVFELTPPATTGGAWTESMLHSFTGQNGDGANPYAGLVIGSNGSLYGTTAFGGSSNYGTVFELTPPATTGGTWTESMLHSFTGQNGDGANPYSGLVMDTNSSLYGTTAYGGAGGLGTAYKLVPPALAGGNWTETVLTTFFDIFEGANPMGGLVFGPNGALYGTTQFGGNVGTGCGTVFVLKP